MQLHVHYKWCVGYAVVFCAYHNNTGIVAHILVSYGYSVVPSHYALTQLYCDLGMTVLAMSLVLPRHLSLSYLLDSTVPSDVDIITVTVEFNKCINRVRYLHGYNADWRLVDEYNQTASKLRCSHDC